jgi:hypothetical protein
VFSRVGADAVHGLQPVQLRTLPGKNSVSCFKES